MTTVLPAIAAFTGSGVTEAGYKSAVSDQRTFLADLLGESGEVFDARKALDVKARGAASVVVSNANVTLTDDEYEASVIIINGTLTADVSLIFPAIAGEWSVINRAIGAYSVTCKTPSGTGVVVRAGAVIVSDGTNVVSAITDVSSGQIQSVTATVAANALTMGLNPTTLSFRSSTLTIGVPNARAFSSALSLVVPSGATLGTVSGQAARLALIAIDNAGAIELAIANLSGGVNLDETTLISTTAISAGATSASVVYSTSTRSNVPFRVVGFVDITETTAGTWAAAPTAIQGQGGQALAALQSIGYGQSWQTVSRTPSATYYNTTGRPIVASMNGGTTMGGSILVAGVVVASVDTGNPTPARGSCSAIVPPGAAYSYTGSGWTAVELR